MRLLLVGASGTDAHPLMEQSFQVRAGMAITSQVK
jgi:hypothetical protein